MDALTKYVICITFFQTLPMWPFRSRILSKQAPEAIMFSEETP